MLEPAVYIYVSAQPAPVTVVIQHFRHAYEIPTCLLTYFAVTPPYVHTDPDSYRALLTSEVLGVGHRIH